MTSASPADPVCLRLPTAVDARVADTLTQDLLALRGRPVRLDASDVERLGGLGLQVLLSARLTWRSDGQGFAVINPSETFRADCSLLGVPTLAELSEGTAP